RRGSFHTPGDPAAPGGVFDVHELDANGAAINAASFASQFAVDFKFGTGLRGEKAKRIEVGLQVSPAPEGIEHQLALRAGRLYFRHTLRSCCHVSRITDAKHAVVDSGQWGTRPIGSPEAYNSCRAQRSGETGSGWDSVRREFFVPAGRGGCASTH